MKVNLIWYMSIATAFPGVKFWWCILFAVDVVVKIFTMTSSTTLFSAILSLCEFGDHILLFPGSKTMMFAVLIAHFLCSLKS